MSHKPALLSKLSYDNTVFRSVLQTPVHRPSCLSILGLGRRSSVVILLLRQKVV